MEQSPFREVCSRAASQEILSPLWNPKVHYRVHNSAPLLTNLSHMHPVHNFPPFSLRSILILSSHLCLRLPSGLFRSVFPTKILYAFIISPMRATCLVHLIFLDLITLIIFGETYN